MKKAIIISILSFITFMAGIVSVSYFLGECNHFFENIEYIAPTCTQDGNIWYMHCTKCDKIYTADGEAIDIAETVIRAEGHMLDKTDYKGATCTVDGNIEFWTCSVCNKKYSDEAGQNEITETAIKADGHKLDKTDYKDATCTVDGNIEFWTCSVCGKKYSDEEGQNEITETAIKADGHKLEKTDYKGATCTVDGNIEFWTCSVCNKKYSDEEGQNEITEMVIVATGHSFDYSYDYENKKYDGNCSVCGDDSSEAAGVEQFPLLARDENELASVVKNAQANAYIKLANDISATGGQYQYVLRLPDNGTLDLGGYTVSVKNVGGFVVEGTDVTFQNGNVVSFPDFLLDYSLFIGDEGDNNRVTLRNIRTEGGINVYNCEAALYDCYVDASTRMYYALWADEHSTITVESGEYFGGKTACIHSTTSTTPDGCGYIVINGGTFHGKIIATFMTTINGGVIDGEISLYNYKDVDTKLVINKDYASELNIVAASADYEIIESVDGDGNFVYEIKLKEENQ